VEAGGKTRLAATDDDNFEMLRRHLTRPFI
jgi:hypothetical protein